MAFILGPGDGILQMGGTAPTSGVHTADTTIIGLSGANSVTFHNGFGRTALGAAVQPHIGDHDDIVADSGNGHQFLSIGDTLQLHASATGGQPFNAVVRAIDPAANHIDITITDVTDLSTYRTNFTLSEITRDTNVITVATGDNTDRPADFINLDDSNIVSVQFFDDGAEHSLNSIIAETNAVTSTGDLTLTFADATAALNAFNFLTGVGDDEVLVSYLPAGVLTHFSWEKTIETGGAASFIARGGYPQPSGTTTLPWIVATGTQDAFVSSTGTILTH